MKFFVSLPKFLSVMTTAMVVAALPLSAHAGEDHDKPAAQSPAGTLVPVDSKTDAAWLAKARAAYGLDRCPVCGDKVDAKSPEYVFQQAGQPDRLVRLCGDMECVPGFTKDSAKYLKLIDDAAAAKAATAKK
jgi:hypothetical protein